MSETITFSVGGQGVTVRLDSVTSFAYRPGVCCHLTAAKRSYGVDASDQVRVALEVTRYLRDAGKHVLGPKELAKFLPGKNSIWL